MRGLFCKNVPGKNGVPASDLSGGGAALADGSTVEGGSRDRYRTFANRFWALCSTLSRVASGGTLGFCVVQRLTLLPLATSLPLGLYLLSIAVGVEGAKPAREPSDGV